MKKFLLVSLFAVVLSVSSIFAQEKMEIFKKITVGDYDPSCMVYNLTSGEYYKVKDFAKLALDSVTYTKTVGTINLTLISVEKLGLVYGATLEQIYERALELGLKLCPSEIGPRLRFLYENQPKGDWIRIAMEPIHFSDGNSVIFSLAHNRLSGEELLVEDGCPNRRWVPETKFVFVVPQADGGIVFSKK